MRDYGSVHTCFWSNPKIQALSDKAKVLALYLLTGPHTNMLGCFRLPMGYIAEDLKWSSNNVSAALDELLKINFANYDSTAQWVFIPRFLEWNAIENPNQGKSIRRLFEQLSDSLHFFPSLITVLLAQPHLDNGFRDRLETLLQQLIDNNYAQRIANNHLETLSKPLLNQEQDQEQDQEQGQDQEKGSGEFPSDHRMPIAVVEIILNDKSVFSISQQKVDEWQLLYPGINVLQTLRHIKSWNEANPKRRKTRNGIVNHIVQWLAKEQNQQGGLSTTPKAVPNSYSQQVNDHNLAVASEWLKKQHLSDSDEENNSENIPGELDQ